MNVRLKLTAFSSGPATRMLPVLHGWMIAALTLTVD